MMRRASAQIFSIGSHRKKHFSFGFRCDILSLVCRCFLKNSILYTEKLKIRIKYSFFHCRSPHGERGLKSVFKAQIDREAGRSPHGERGLKCVTARAIAALNRSLPTRGAWIEIPHSEQICMPSSCRSPHGERGLKSPQKGQGLRSIMSLPTRGAWIEISW